MVNDIVKRLRGDGRLRPGERQVLAEIIEAVEELLHHSPSAPKITLRVCLRRLDGDLPLPPRRKRRRSPAHA